jgi:predicted SPOUT superfamily RNA methylase MTH1
MTRLTLPALLFAVVLAACSQPKTVDITRGSQKVQTASRTEPIFYNGKHYSLRYTYNESLKVFDMKVTGTTATMKAGDQKDAEAIATSALGHFACPDGQRGRLSNTPKYAGGAWSMQARCG